MVRNGNKENPSYFIHTRSRQVEDLNLRKWPFWVFMKLTIVSGQLDSRQ